MAIRQSNKRTDSLNIGSLANPGNEQDVGKVHKAALFKVDISGKILNKNSEGVFLLNPSAIEESKSAKWVAHEVPGQSEPIYQWITSGPRTLTFDALVTADTSDIGDVKNELFTKESNPEPSTDVIADLAVKLFKVQIPPKRNTGNVIRNSDTLDISNRLDYYRSLMYPQYTNPNNKGVPGRLKSSPPLVVLFAGNSISNLAYSDRITNKHDVWVVTDLKIRITKQLPNLAPMEAHVTFTLAHYNIRSSDSSKYHKDIK